MAKKKATKKANATEEKKEKIVKKVEDKTYKIKFDSNMKDRDFYEPGFRYEDKPNSKGKKKVKVIDPIRMKQGETKVLTQEEFDYLISKNLILTPERKKHIDGVRRKYLNVKSGREEPKQEMQVISDEDKVKIYVDLPHLVTKEEPEEEEE